MYIYLSIYLDREREREREIVRMRSRDNSADPWHNPWLFENYLARGVTFKFVVEIQVVFETIVKSQCRICCSPFIRAALLGARSAGYRRSANCTKERHQAPTTTVHFSGPETGKRKLVTRKADGKLTRLVNLGGPGTKSYRRSANCTKERDRHQKDSRSTCARTSLCFSLWTHRMQLVETKHTCIGKEVHMTVSNKYGGMHINTHLSLSIYIYI